MADMGVMIIGQKINGIAEVNKVIIRGKKYLLKLTLELNETINGIIKENNNIFLNILFILNSISSTYLIVNHHYYCHF